jgi:hypothetical protein
MHETPIHRHKARESVHVPEVPEGIEQHDCTFPKKLAPLAQMIDEA